MADLYLKVFNFIWAAICVIVPVFLAMFVMAGFAVYLKMVQAWG
jgi:hypothetical protein